MPIAGMILAPPIWRNVSQADVNVLSPSFAGKLAQSTALATVEEIATESLKSPGRGARRGSRLGTTSQPAARPA
jgi:hypothetical protein